MVQKQAEIRLLCERLSLWGIWGVWALYTKKNYHLKDVIPILKGKTSLWRLSPSPLLRHLTPGRPDILAGEHSWLKAVLTLQTQTCVGAAALRWQSPWLDVNGSFVWRLWLSQGHLVIRAARLINPRGIYFIYSPHSSFKVKVSGKLSKRLLLWSYCKFSAESEGIFALSPFLYGN